MLKLITSFKPLKALDLIKPAVQTRSLYLHPIPKAYIATTEEAAPKKKSASTVKKDRKKQQNFKQQLWKKNQERIKNLLKEFVHLVVHGSKSAYKDTKFLAGVVSSKPKKAYSIEEIRELERSVRDLIKFVPFYAAIIIPAGELVLPIYLFLFPRAVPSYFRTETQMKEERYQLIDHQARAHKYLMTHVLSLMIKAGYDPSVKDPEGMKKFFIEKKQRLLPLLKIENMDSEMLRNANDFLMYEYVEGTYILNLLYRTTVNLPRLAINAAMWVARNPYRAIWTHPFFNWTFRMNFFPFEWLKRGLLRYQYKRQLKIMKDQNYAIMLNLFGKLEEEGVLSVARERGHYADKEEDAKKWLKEDWTKVSKINVENELFLFWYSVIVYEHLS